MHCHEIRANERIRGSRVARVFFYPLCWLESAYYNSRDIKYRKGEQIADYITGKKQIPKQWYEAIKN
jgi:hypothetical protein